MIALSSPVWIVTSWSCGIVARCSGVAGFIFGKTRTAASRTPRLVPSGLNDCARLSRLVAVPSGPIAMANGLAEVSRTERPAARMNRAMRKKPKVSDLAAG